MNIKKFLWIFVIAILLLIVIYGRTGNIKFTEESSLTNSIKEHIDKQSGVEFIRAYDNSIYGSIFDSSKSNTILETTALFSYSVKNKKLLLYEYTGKNRIMDFIVKDNFIYFVELEEVENNRFIWKFIKSDLQFKNLQNIKSGVIENPFSYPRIFMSSSYIILVSINDEQNIQKYEISKVIGDSIEELQYEIGYKDKKKGNILYNIENVCLNNNKLYYTVVDEKNIQYLISLDIIKNEKSNVFVNNKNDEIIYNYKPLKKGIYIQLALKNLDNTSNFIYMQDDKVIVKKQGDIKTMDTTYNNIVIFHNQENTFEFFSEDTLKLKKFNINQRSIYPKYVILDGKLYIQDFSNKFYVSENIMKYI